MDIKDKAVVTKRYRAQNLASKDKADCTNHIEKCVKEIPRPYLTREILYNEDLWTEWALQPFDISVLMARRNNDGDMFFIHDSDTSSVTVMVCPLLHILNILLLKILLKRLAQFQNLI
ncbi:hypothetical protein MKX03_003252 [Papaver bracteatum]|nr:hypothetical protein MKX03_003252 [Papaver bracteatum]